LLTLGSVLDGMVGEHLVLKESIGLHGPIR
jgi:hypothetical protein